MQRKIYVRHEDFLKTMYLLLVFVMSINYIWQLSLLVMLSVHTG